MDKKKSTGLLLGLFSAAIVACVCFILGVVLDICGVTTGLEYCWREVLFSWAETFLFHKDLYGLPIISLLLDVIAGCIIGVWLGFVPGLHINPEADRVQIESDQRRMRREIDDTLQEYLEQLKEKTSELEKTGGLVLTGIDSVRHRLQKAEEGNWRKEIEARILDSDEQ